MYKFSEDEFYVENVIVVSCEDGVYLRFHGHNFSDFDKIGRLMLQYWLSIVTDDVINEVLFNEDFIVAHVNDEHLAKYVTIRDNRDVVVDIEDMSVVSR